MKSIQLIKQLNNTELGKSGTHDTYVLVPNDLNVSDIFSEVNTPIDFHDLDSGEVVTIRNTQGREKRIVGLGNYYRSKNLSAGDEILFERRSLPDGDKYIIGTRKLIDYLVFQKNKAGFEILTPERISLANDWSRRLSGTFRIDFLTSAKKRNDSAEPTNFYDIIVENKSILSDYSAKGIGFLTMKENKISLESFYGWKKYVIDWEK